jgi:hypothetical protein
VTAIIEALSGSKLIAALIGVGVLMISAAVLWAVALYTRALTQTDRLKGLIAGGDTREARVQARNGGSTLRPFLEALTGDPIPPIARSVSTDAVLIGLVVLPPIALVAVGFELLKTAQKLEAMPIAAAMMTGVVILLPLSIAAVVIIGHLGVRTSRAVRCACVALLLDQVRSGGFRERHSNPPPRPRPSQPAEKESAS